MLRELYSQFPEISCRVFPFKQRFMFFDRFYYNTFNHNTTNTIVLGIFKRNVGIGTTAPAGLLHLNSSLGAGVLRVENTTGASLLFVNGTTGNVGIGTTGPTQRLTVSGHGNFTGNLTLGSPSLRNGITMHDTADGSVHCVTIASDALSVGAGACRND